MVGSYRTSLSIDVAKAIILVVAISLYPYTASLRSIDFAVTLSSEQSYSLSSDVAKSLLLLIANMLLSVFAT
jgi:hypothetical protein